MVTLFKKSNKMVSNKIDASKFDNEDFASLLDIQMGSYAKEGSVVQGQVVGLQEDYVVVDIGLKSEGIVPKNEFEIIPEIGETIEVYLEKVESRSGKTILSKTKALREAAWVGIKSALAEGKTVTGYISNRVKGGFTVDLSGILAFLPGSQVDIRQIKDINALMGVEQKFKILKIDDKHYNIVVSRRAILEESRLEARNEVLANIKEGAVLEGYVKNITDYGAFIDLGSFDGLLHLTDISWNRINHPSEILALGQQIKVMVIKYNAETKRVSLGMKQLEENPWSDIEQRFPRNTVITGKISNITDYGAFVQLEEGIEGLVHVSEMTWNKNNTNPRKLVSVGSTVSCMVLDVDANKHRISLGMKQCTENPWQVFANKHSEGAIVDGIITNIVDFGVFVGFEGDIEGLIHVSDLSWDGDQHEVLKGYRKGDPIKAKVMLIDVDKERISLSVKNLEEDPHSSTLGNISKGSIVECEVAEVKSEGIDVRLDNMILFIKRSELSNDKDGQKPESFNVGDKVEAKVVSMDKSTRKISLSIKALESDEHKRVMSEYSGNESGSSSLGDLLGNVLNSKK